MKIFAFVNLVFLERTVEKFRYLRLSTSHRKSRTKRHSQATSPPPTSSLQSPVLSEGRGSSSSVANTAGCYLMSNNDHDDEDFEEEPMKLFS